MFGAHWAEAHAHAGTLAANSGGELIHPFEGQDTWDGHASVMDEIRTQLPVVAAASGVSGALEPGTGAPGALLVSVGGGGLLLGALRGRDAAGWASSTTIVAAETVGADCLAQALAAGQLVTLPGITSVATSLGAPSVSPTALAACSAPGARVTSQVVTDAAAVRACTRLLDDHRLLVEPACGAALAPVYDSSPALAAARSVVVIVCGGACVTADGLRAMAVKTAA